MATIAETEKRLAVTTNWAVFGAFGLCFILSGFQAERVGLTLLGFGGILAGFIAHVLINRVYRVGFSKGEVVAGFVAFGVSLLAFILNWLANPRFGTAEIISGVAGFGAIVVTFFLYLVFRFGVRGSFSMFHVQRGRAAGHVR